VTARPARNPSSEVITRRALESIMRPATASGEKPPKITEWIAPMPYRQLHRDVCRFANVLLDLGIKKGDVVAIYMPMVDHQASAGVDNASGNRFWRKAAEDNRMDSADARAGQHGDGRFRHHRHIDSNDIAFFNPEPRGQLSRPPSARARRPDRDHLGRRRRQPEQKHHLRA
jgi:acyl-CoA synthetase (AMP-forming)/AMP-acid ligase II